MPDRTINFVVEGNRAEISFSVTQAQPDARTIDLQPVPSDAPVYLFMGAFDGGSGQCQDEIRTAALAAMPDDTAARVIRLCDLWDALHLNNMNPGTIRQMDAVAMAKAKLSEGESFGYDASRVELMRLRVLSDRGYEYGSAWLYRPIDPTLVTEVMAHMDALDGARIGSAVSSNDLDDCDFSNSDDIINSDDIVKRVEYLTDFLADNPDHEDATDELATLKSLEAEASGYAGDWQHGTTLIRDSYFEDYAQELAEDTGMLIAGATWPNNCIDWERAARELQADYTSVSFDGVDYWIR